MPDKRFITPLRIRLARRLALVIIASCFAASSVAQEYRTDPIKAEARGHLVDVQRSVKTPADYAANKAKFDEFFAQFYFPMMTRPTPDGLAVLGKMRADLFSRYLWETTNAQLQADLTKLAYDAMLKISANVTELKPQVKVADPPYHPAVRYNAILIVGMLDEKYAVPGVENSKPVPYPPATKILTQIVDSATSTNRFPPSVVLGALVGLERHARYRDTMDPAVANAMTKALLKFANHEKPIQDMDRKAYAWLRLRAANALATMGQVGQDNAVHDTLIKLIGNFKSLDDRCETAAMLARLNYEGAKVDPQPALGAIFQLARDLSAAEVKRAEDFELMRSSGSGVAFELMQPGFNGGNQEPYDPYPRRHVLARLLQLRAGLEALKKAVPEDDQKNLDGLQAAIKPVIDKAQDEKTISGRVAEAVGMMAVAIDQAIPAGDADAAIEEELEIEVE
jgi:hypothetical protein